MRILVVEDEKLLCDGIAEDLELEKYTVERCYDGAEAYDLLLSESFDLLILDINLPDGNGLDFLRALRQEHAVGRDDLRLAGAQLVHVPEHRAAFDRHRAVQITGVILRPAAAGRAQQQQHTQQQPERAPLTHGAPSRRRP